MFQKMTPEAAGVSSRRVQIIDRYLGNATMYFAFRGKDVAVRMIRSAEAFLREYDGCFVASLA